MSEAKLFSMNLTQDEVVLITSCMTICASAFSGKKPDLLIVRSTQAMGKTILPGLTIKLDEAWDAFGLPPREPL
jgi:hypothetical protein